MIKGGLKLEINIPPRHILAISKGGGVGLIIEGGIISSKYGILFTGRLVYHCIQKLAY